MKLIRVTGVSLVAVIALGGMCAAQASAEAPEFGRCLKKAVAGGTGYSDSKCTKASEGSRAKYEWAPGAVAGHNRFTITGGGVTWETAGGSSFVCSEGAIGAGEYSLTNSKREGAVSMEFKDCKADGFACTTVGRPTGDIVFNELAGEIGYEVEGASPRTVLKLEPGPTARGKFIEFKCVGIELKWRGREELPGAGILVPIKNDVMASTTTLSYAESHGIQKPVEWQGMPTETFLEQKDESLGYEQLGWRVTMTVKNEEEMEYEVNAVI